MQVHGVFPLFRILLILHFGANLCQRDLQKPPGHHKLDAAALKGNFLHK